MDWPIKVVSLDNIHLRPRAHIERMRNGCGEYALSLCVRRERHGAVQVAGGCAVKVRSAYLHLRQLWLVSCCP